MEEKVHVCSTFRWWVYPSSLDFWWLLSHIYEYSIYTNWFILYFLPWKKDSTIKIGFKWGFPLKLSIIKDQGTGFLVTSIGTKLHGFNHRWISWNSYKNRTKVSGDQDSDFMLQETGTLVKSFNLLYIKGLGTERDQVLTSWHFIVPCAIYVQHRVKLIKHMVKLEP